MKNRKEIGFWASIPAIDIVFLGLYIVYCMGVIYYIPLVRESELIGLAGTSGAAIVFFILVSRASAAKAYRMAAEIDKSTDEFETRTVYDRSVMLSILSVVGLATVSISALYLVAPILFSMIVSAHGAKNLQRMDKLNDRLDQLHKEENTVY